MAPAPTAFTRGRGRGIVWPFFGSMGLRWVGRGECSAGSQRSLSYPGPACQVGFSPTSLSYRPGWTSAQSGWSWVDPWYGSERKSRRLNKVKGSWGCRITPASGSAVGRRSSCVSRIVFPLSPVVPAAAVFSPSMEPPESMRRPCKSSAAPTGAGTEGLPVPARQVHRPGPGSLRGLSRAGVRRPCLCSYRRRWPVRSPPRRACGLSRAGRRSSGVWRGRLRWWS